jgi:chaperonin GroES
MATAPDMMLTEEIDDGPGLASETALTLQQILEPGVNLAEYLEESMLNEIGQAVIRDVEIDRASRGDWEEQYSRSLDIAMQVRSPKNFPWPNASNVKYPILTVASIQFQARAYPAIVDGSNLVKGRVLGPDPDGTKRARADRIGSHMTWQLLYRMKGWEEETDKLLLMLPITGCVFRKTWYDAILGCNRSEMVSADDFIIEYDAKSIEAAPRYTQVLHYYPYEVREFIAAGQWLQVPTDDHPEGQASEDDQALGDYYEQHRCLDLDEDGIVEHYVVTCTKEGKVARINPCFGVEDITVAIADPQDPDRRTVATEKLEKILKDYGEQGLMLVSSVVRIQRRQYFTKYEFIPAPDGSFYGIGFGSLLYDITDTIDTTLNQMLDAGALQNAQGGFVGSGVNVRGGNFRFALGEWKRVDVTGGKLSENILPMNLPGPSAVLFNLLQLLIDAAKEITATSDISLGELPANAPATSALAAMEQTQKVMTGIFKRIHRAFGNELRILRRLNRDFLDEEEYFQLNDEEAVQIGRQDYADEDLDVIPVSDPNQVSDMQKIARASAIMEAFRGDPEINQKLIKQNLLEAVGARDIKAYFDVPQPPPPPELLKIMNDGKKVENDRTRAQAEASTKFADGAVKLASIGLLDDAATLAAHAVEESAEEDMDEQAHGQGGVPEMAGGPPDAGLPGLPEGAPGPLGPEMGAGGAGDELAGAPSPSGPAGPVI